MGININRKKGQLNRSEPTEDKVICLVMSGAAVAGKLALSECKQIYGSDALTTLGITEANNPVAFRDISDFYAKAGEGSELNFMLVSDTTSLANICDKANAIAKKLLDFTEGRAVVLLVNKKLPAGYEMTVTNGLDADVWAAVTKMQEMADDFQKRNMPFVGILPAIGFDFDTLANLPARSTLSNDFVALSAFCEKSNGHISMGVLAAWIAKHQVHQNIGRVKSGKVTDTGYFPDGTQANETAVVNARTALDAKGIIFPIKIAGKTGYLFNDDPCLTATSSDYSSISWNRVINKAQRISYGVLVEKLNDDVDVNAETGKIETGLASDWESDVEGAIRSQMMTASGNRVNEISGVKCTLDPNSDVVNDVIDAELEIVRKGQAKTINLNIGYAVSLSE